MAKNRKITRRRDHRKAEINNVSDLDVWLHRLMYLNIWPLNPGWCGDDRTLLMSDCLQNPVNGADMNKPSFYVQWFSGHPNLPKGSYCELRATMSFSHAVTCLFLTHLVQGRVGCSRFYYILGQLKIPSYSWFPSDRYVTVVKLFRVILMGREGFRFKYVGGIPWSAAVHKPIQ